MPPNASPNTHTTRPQPTLTPPAALDQYPRGATRRNTPTPIWIHTVAAAADTGWFDQVVHPARGGACRRSDDGPRQAEWHRSLDLEQAVEDPDDPEGDPEHPASRRLRIGLRLHDGGIQGAGSRRPPETDRSDGIPCQRQDDQEQHDEEELVQ